MYTKENIKPIKCFKRIPIYQFYFEKWSPFAKNKKETTKQKP